MKRSILTLALVLAAGAVHAFPGLDPVYYPAEVKAVEAEMGAKTVGDLKVSELIPIANRLDIARQKDEYVLKMAKLSMFWPGAGEFSTGHWTSGALQTGLHLGITAGTLVWANAVLPSDVRVGNLDYFGTSFTTIHNTWGAHTLYEFFPTIGVLLLGGVAEVGLRAWSANEAQQFAKERIDEGKITFEPRFDGEHLGFGMRF
jgi:hypothetical protein